MGSYMYERPALVDQYDVRFHEVFSFRVTVALPNLQQVALRGNLDSTGITSNRVSRD